MNEQVQKYILEMLNILSLRIPGKKHCFLLGDEGRLHLIIQIDGIFQPIIFDEQYENMEPSQLANNIVNDLVKAGYKISNLNAEAAQKF